MNDHNQPFGKFAITVMVIALISGMLFPIWRTYKEDMTGISNHFAQIEKARQKSEQDLKYKIQYQNADLTAKINANNRSLWQKTSRVLDSFSKKSITEINKAELNCDKKLKASVAGLDSRVDTLGETISRLEHQIDGIKKDLKSIEKTVDSNFKMIHKILEKIQEKVQKNKKRVPKDNWDERQ